MAIDWCTRFWCAFSWALLFDLKSHLLQDKLSLPLIQLKGFFIHYLRLNLRSIFFISCLFNIRILRLTMLIISVFHQFTIYFSFETALITRIIVIFTTKRFFKYGFNTSIFRRGFLSYILRIYEFFFILIFKFV